VEWIVSCREVLEGKLQHQASFDAVAVIFTFVHDGLRDHIKQNGYVLLRLQDEVTSKEDVRV
jgi:hypothetical protein